MGHGSDQGEVMIQEQTLNMFKEPTSGEKQKVELPFGRPYIDPNCVLEHNAGDEHVVKCRSPEKMAHNNDELVINMLNLPCFLEGVENNKNVQEKALTFGVLEWKRLEKWKFNERMPVKNIGKTSFHSRYSFSTPKGPPKISPNLRKHPSSHNLYPSSSPGKPPIAHGSRLSSLSENKSPSFYSYHLNEAEIYAAPVAHEKIESWRQKDEPRFGEVNSESFHPELQNVVLQEPEDWPRRSYSESSQCTDSRISIDEQLAEETGSRMSVGFSPREHYSGQLSAHIPHSFPKASVATVLIETATPTSSAGKSSAVDDASRHSFSVEGSKKMRTSVSKDPTSKERHPSPIHRFSFNLGRMSKSFIFRENSAATQLTSLCNAAKYETAKPEISSNINNFDRAMTNSSTRGRSSPLRRFLDPLLKHKGAQLETVHPPNESLQSKMSKDMATGELSQDNKLVTSTFKASFHLTLKNGLPFFKFVVANKISMLAAVKNWRPSSEKTGKNDKCTIFAFYSVHEIQKKGMNWMSHGSKTNGCSDLGYSIMGQMRISSSYISEDSGRCVERECVLYSADPGEVIKQTQEFSPNKEIVAIVVKNSSDKVNNKELSGRKGSHNGNRLENEIFNSTVVILPGGVHGIPITGAPSPLISRWRSYGTCDCGGWDVGCKLRVLTSNHDNSCNFLQQSISESAIDLVYLFLQEGGHKKRPVLRLELVGDGFYSVEVDAPVSLLEAFATCVAFATCRKFYKILDADEHSDRGLVPERDLRTDSMNKTLTSQGPIPAEYSTRPPLSSVRRILEGSPIFSQREE